MVCRFDCIYVTPLTIHQLSSVPQWVTTDGERMAIDLFRVSAIRLHIAIFLKSNFRQWTSYTSVCRSSLCLILLLHSLCLASSGRPLERRKPAEGSWRLCRSRLHSFYKRLKSTAADECWRSGLRHLWQTYAGLWCLHALDLVYSLWFIAQIT
jgi:hypothetical protein